MAYRWDIKEFAEGYDEAAAVVHPHYVEIQDVILDQLPRDRQESFWLVDAGGGSGRLAERVLDRYGHAQVVNVDQSEAFLGLAKARVARFGDRYRAVQARLQDAWQDDLPERPRFIVSMSAIHHLDAEEKQTLYARCASALTPSGMLLNGDEVRADHDLIYRSQLIWWGNHMERLIEQCRVPEMMYEILRSWVERNVAEFDGPRVSGDDCHDTVGRQLAWFRDAGLTSVRCLWRAQCWAVLAGVRPTD